MPRLDCNSSLFAICLTYTRSVPLPSRPGPAPHNHNPGMDLALNRHPRGGPLLRILLLTPQQRHHHRRGQRSPAPPTRQPPPHQIPQQLDRSIPAPPVPARRKPHHGHARLGARLAHPRREPRHRTPARAAGRRARADELHPAAGRDEVQRRARERREAAGAAGLRLGGRYCCGAADARGAEEGEQRFGGRAGLCV